MTHTGNPAGCAHVTHFHVAQVWLMQLWRIQDLAGVCMCVVRVWFYILSVLVLVCWGGGAHGWNRL